MAALGPMQMKEARVIQTSGLPSRGLQATEIQ